MPAASHSPTGTALEGSILLIEEYDALAAAISSALRKFAPGREVHVARSLNEAKTLAKEIEPALLVIDFDPAFPGLSAFLQKMQTRWPEARALIVAGKLPAKIEKIARSAGALQFVEKPFDLPEFGASVQALLGPWRESEGAASRGTLPDLTLADLVIAQCAGARTVAIEVTNGNGKSGEILVRLGTPSHAEAGRKSGADALRDMLSWDKTVVRERERPRFTHRTIESDWPELLVEAFRRVKPRKSKSLPKAVATPPAKPSKKLVVIDDTEMLLIFVDDVLATNYRDYQITTAPNGLKGIKEIERIKPDLILLDYSLPDINGDEVCRRLLQNEATSHIPVLMMSGHIPEMSRAAATLDNIVATIEKPFLSDALVNLVQQVLTEKRAVQKKPPVAKRTQQPAPAPVAELPKGQQTSPAPSTAPASTLESKPPVPPSPAEPAPVSYVGAGRVEPIGTSVPSPVAPEKEHVEPIPAPAPAAVRPGPPTPPPARKPEPVFTKPDPVTPPFSPGLLGTETTGPRIPPPVQAKPERAAPKAEPVTPIESVVEKARKAIGQLRRQIASRDTSGSTTEVALPAEPVPSIPLTPAPAPARTSAPPPQFRQETPAHPPPQGPEVMSTRVLSEGPNEVVLAVFLDVVSVQLTPELRMGSIRAKPSSTEVSLHVISPGMRGKLPQTGFQLGQVNLDGKGRIATMRLIPTQGPIKVTPTQNSFQIGAVSVVPINSTARMQLTPTPGAPMVLQLLAHLELAGVELSPTFQISQIVLKDRGRPIRVTMSSQLGGQDENGTACEAVAVKLDHSARIAELLLNPLR